MTHTSGSDVAARTIFRLCRLTQFLVLQGCLCSVFLSGADAAVLKVTPLGTFIRQTPLPSLSSGGMFAVGRDGERFTRAGQTALWSMNGGMEGLGVLPGHSESSATGISADGSVIVGASGNAVERDYTVYKWTESTGMEPLWFGTAEPAISPDGSTIVGELGGVAVRWNQDNGLASLGNPLGAHKSTAVAASVAGDAIALRATELNPSTGKDVRTFATLWTEEEGHIEIGPLPNDWRQSQPWGVSDDGKTVLGNSGPGSGITMPFLWTHDQGVQLLPELEGVVHGEVFPLLMSSDASIVTGTYTSVPEVGNLPFVWDAHYGTRDLGQVLVDDHGLDSVFFNSVRAMSPDATALFVTKFGSGIEPAGWVIQLDRPLVSPTLAGDTDHDGVVNIEDLNNVRNNFGGSGLGDTNQDGVINIVDLNAVRNNFGAGEGAQAVPEPSAALLLSCSYFAMLGFLITRRVTRRTVASAG